MFQTHHLLKKGDNNSTCLKGFLRELSDFVSLELLVHCLVRNGSTTLVGEVSPLVFTARSYRDLPSWHWNPGLGTWCGAGTPHSWDVPPKFLSTTRGCGATHSTFCISMSPTCRHGCGFFNFVIVGLPFSLLSGGSVMVVQWFSRNFDVVV